MKKLRTKMILGACVILAIAVIVFADRQQYGNEKGMVMEDFQLPMYEQDEGQLYDYKGDVIVLNLWASWCKPCRDEMPELMELQADYTEKSLSIVTVNMQKTERTLNDAAEFIEEIDLTLPVFFDEDGELLERLDVRHMPTTYIIDREGEIKQIFMGEVTYEMIEEEIEPLL
ncbi:TlpA disulfide reductase family protein [Halalkalibacter sp. APA_J-10(15)]|uniref:TlpA disulfide reductase family protein n=1 Tax=Halalkalibacter sp. APA_J-10(15) TaxID=2933805 RepID=UPI001FF4D9F9|nr:TlpA disulfide reductase family protein [Halalkalibacter sp. APA_J-10(15)]MCK0473801.1 TlpA family protein disulfide reductase [Halalkalibacter sp. APA_J-10(15)]